MKANQKFVHAEEAVSPVIAVILMVAITVVLAATVFVLVNDLGKNVGSSGPSLGLVSDSAGSSTAKWTVKMSSATQLADLADYRFVLTTPSHGSIVATPSPTGGAFTTEYRLYAQQQNTLDANRKTMTTYDDTADRVGYNMTWLDVDGNSKYSVGDTLTISYDSTTADESAETAPTNENNNFDDTFTSGAYTLEVLHIPSGSSAASLPRTF